MTTRRWTMPQLAGTTVAAVFLVAVAPAPGFAQQSDPSARTLKSGQPAAGRSAQKPAKAVQRATASARPADKQRPEWTIENALPDHSASMRQYDSPIPQGKIGRVPLQSGQGTVGFETETRSNAYQTPDGRTIPGLQGTENRSNSYLGLSLSVPTSDKALNFPVPLAEPWNRP